MMNIFMCVIALAGIWVSLWSFKHILRIVIGCVVVAHGLPESDKRNHSFMKESRTLLRFYYLMLAGGFSMIGISSVWFILL